MVINGEARSAAHVPAHNVCFFLKLMVRENLWQLKSRWRASFVDGLQQRRQEKGISSDQCLVDLDFREKSCTIEEISLLEHEKEDAEKLLSQHHLCFTPF